MNFAVSSDMSVQHDFNGSQTPPEWHSWLTHIRKEPPTQDPIVKMSTQKWQAVSRPSTRTSICAHAPYSLTLKTLLAREVLTVRTTLQHRKSKLGNQRQLLGHELARPTA